MKPCGHAKLIDNITYQTIGRNRSGQNGISCSCSVNSCSQSSMKPYELQSSAPPHQINRCSYSLQRFELCAEEPQGFETPCARKTHTENVKRRIIITVTKRIQGDNSMVDKASNQEPRACSRKMKKSMAE